MSTLAETTLGGGDEKLVSSLLFVLLNLRECRAFREEFAPLFLQQGTGGIHWTPYLREMFGAHAQNALKLIGY